MGTMTAEILTSNGTSIPFTPHYFAALKDTDAGVEAAELRARYDADGYVMLRGAVPAHAVLDLREAYLSRFAPGLCKDGDTRRGAFTGSLPTDLPPHGFPGHPAYDFVRSDVFNAFADLPVFKTLAEAFFEAPAARIRRTPLRHFLPGRQIASRPHMDRTYIDGVAADVVTIWVPLGDSPLVSGGLLYLEGSHRDADLEQNVRAAAPNDRSDRRSLSNDLKWVADRTGRRWLSADYRAGDVVIHSPAIVHASTDPGDTDYMRISTDLRFRRIGAPVDPRWANDWSADDGY
jgi:hypothetical protein